MPWTISGVGTVMAPNAGERVRAGQVSGAWHRRQSRSGEGGGKTVTGQLIVVTGATGAGKTTTCATFIDEAQALWVHFGADLLLGKTLSRRFVDGGARSNEGVHIVPDDPQYPEGPAHLDLGRYGMGLFEAMHEMAAAAVRCGQNVIMDHVTTLHPPLLQDCVARLKGLPVLFVGLKPDPQLLSRRIDERLAGIIESMGPEHGRRANEGTKRVADYMFREIFSHDRFDLVIDNSALPPKAVVAAIVARLEQGPGEAFQTLAGEFGV